LFDRLGILLKLDRVVEAEATCRRILKINPDADRAHSRLIYIYALSLRRQKLREQVLESLSRGCEPPEAYVYLFTAAQSRFSNGEDVNAGWVKQDPDNETFLVARAYFHFLATTDQNAQLVKLPQDPDNQAMLMEECIKRFPKNHVVIEFQLEKAVRAGSIERVARILSATPKSAQRSSLLWRAKGWYHLAQATISSKGSQEEKMELQRAENALQQALARDPYDWRARNHLAAVFRRQERKQQLADAAATVEIGKKLEKEIMEMAKSDDIANVPGFLERMAEYSLKCGDRSVYDALRQRLQ